MGRDNIERYVARCFSVYDADQSGSIDFNEFIKLFADVVTNKANVKRAPVGLNVRAAARRTGRWSRS